MNDIIILPENFKRPRYMGGAWFDFRRNWTEEDVTLLTAAADLGISYTSAANTLGRPPTALVDKAFRSGIRIPREWRALLYKPSKKQPRLNLEYPYIVKPTQDHADLIAVNRMVSRAMPGREDVCQDIMLALWESRTSLAELRADPKAVRAFTKAFRKASFERSGYAVESMDATIHTDDDWRSKYEDARYQRTLVNPDDQFIEGNLFGKGYTENFEDHLIRALSNEEEELGVPAAFWMRAELQ